MTNTAPTRTIIDGRDHWLFDDGHTLPVIHGGSDDGDAAGESAGAEPMAAEPAPASDPAPAEPAVDASVLDTDLPEGMRSFDRSYVEKLRAEAGGNRTKARELEQRLAEQAAQLEKFSPFEGYSEDDMVVWGELATSWKDDPTVAASRMQEIAYRVLGDPTATADERADAQAIVDNPAVRQAADELTPDRIRQIAREEADSRDAERTETEAVEAVFKQISTAGYEEGTPEMFQVLWYANNKTEGDIDKALKMQRDAEQAIVDRYVESMAKGGTPVRLPSSGLAGTPSTEAPSNINEARQQADAWLRERSQAG